jgi:hypothetical protein
MTSTNPMTETEWQESAVMTDTTIKIESDETGITLSCPSPSPEWSITGQGGRADMVFISDADLPAVLEAMQQRINEIREVAA